MSGGVFTRAGRAVDAGKPAATIAAFVIFMAAVVAERRGGKASQYTHECADFMEMVVGRRLSIRDPLPADYDWTPAAAQECALAMMEYDN